MISGLLVDTDVLSFLFKGDTRADPYRPLLRGRLLVVSFMTVAELERWTLIRSWGARRRAELATFLGDFVLYPVDHELCRVWARITVEARTRGRPIADADAWIAATALRAGVPLLTHNHSDFADVPGLDVVVGA